MFQQKQSILKKYIKNNFHFLIEKNKEVNGPTNYKNFKHDT